MGKPLANLIKTRSAQQIAAQGTEYTLGQALPLADIRTDGGTQARAGVDETTIQEYAQAMQGGAEFPLIVVFHDGESYWLADGFHRAAAAQRIGRTELRAAIQSGTRRDAILYACGANDKHGMRRTQADKRRAIERLLRDEEWRQWSDSEIARRCAVDHKTVASVRADLYPGNSHDSRTVERNGTTYQQKPPERRGERQPPTPPAEQAPLPAMPAPAQPADLPPEFAIIQRRLRAHDIELLTNMQGYHRAFVTRKAGMAGVVTFAWADVLSKLERLEHTEDTLIADQIAADSAGVEHPNISEVAAAAPARRTCPTCGEVILNGIWGELNECGSCYHARQRQPPDPTPPDLAALDATIPPALEAAGYYWHSASPPTLAQNGSAWRAERPTFEAALQLAYDRERQQAAAQSRRLTPGAHAQAMTLLGTIRTALITEHVDQAETLARQLVAVIASGEAED